MIDEHINTASEQSTERRNERCQQLGHLQYRTESRSLGFNSNPDTSRIAAEGLITGDTLLSATVRLRWSCGPRWGISSLEKNESTKGESMGMMMMVMMWCIVTNLPYDQQSVVGTVQWVTGGKMM